jgi:hypothetical protein
LIDDKSQVKYDARLSLPLDFVCKILEVKKEDFASLSISNLLEMELDWIENNGFHADSKEIKKHKETVDAVKFEADGWVINRK